MKNKKILAIITLIIGLLLIVLALFLKNDASTPVTDLEFSNLQITSNNSFRIDVYNPTNSKKEITKVTICLLNNSNKLIMNAVIEIPNLNSRERKTIEYSQAGNFSEMPVDFYVKKYTGEETLKENISEEAKIGNILLQVAKEVVNENSETFENFNGTLTALSLKNDYHKNLSELEEYECSLEETFVVVEFKDNNYNYTAYLNCELFIEK